MSAVKVCGADWCHDTKRALSYLNDRGVDYDYQSVEDNPQVEQWVKDKNGGKRKLPTIQIGEQILSVPSNRELEDALKQLGAAS